MAQERMLAASVGFGRLAGAGGQLVGQAAGAVLTGAVGGVVRLAGGAADGVSQAVAGLRQTETPSPMRPRVLELTSNVSEAGSQEAVTATASAAAEPSTNPFEMEVLGQLKAMKTQMEALREHCPSIAAYGACGGPSMRFLILMVMLRMPAASRGTEFLQLEPAPVNLPESGLASAERCENEGCQEHLSLKWRAPLSETARAG